MGEEMTEQMSEEITKAMDEQRSLEQKYASLVTRRGQLKGLSDKKELAETKAQISVSTTCNSNRLDVFSSYLIIISIV
jgi:hypothetical protein